MTYGARIGCTGPTTLPVQCDAELEETFTLTQAQCELPCTGEIDSSKGKPRIRRVC